MRATKVGIREFRSGLAEFIAAANPVAITRHGHTVAYLIPADPQADATAATPHDTSVKIDPMLSARKAVKAVKTGKSLVRKAASEQRAGQATPHAIIALARGVRDLQQQASQQYRPVVDQILRTGRRDAAHIERTLDGLLDFCGHEPVLMLYRRLCRHYWTIDPAATADYIRAYRERWEGADEGNHR